jgi:hypothetical protein
MLKKPIYISTKFLDCEVESVSYKICYEINSYGEHFERISKVKIEEATIHINWTGIYQFLKYYFDKNEIFYPAKPEEWDANLGKDEFFFLSKLYEERVPGTSYYDELVYIHPVVIPDDGIIRYSYPELKINVYPLRYIYQLLVEVVDEIKRKIIKRIKTDILRKELFQYYRYGQEIKDFYRYDIDLRRTSVGSSLKKYAKYNKAIIKAIEAIEMKLDFFMKSENFIKIIKEYTERTNLEKFLEELKENFRFWNEFYDEFCNKYLRNSGITVGIYPILRYSNFPEVKCFIIPKIHKKAFEMVKNSLSIFAL